MSHFFENGAFFLNWGIFFPKIGQKLKIWCARHMRVKYALSARESCAGIRASVRNDARASNARGYVSALKFSPRKLGFVGGVICVTKIFWETRLTAGDRPSWFSYTSCTLTKNNRPGQPENIMYISLLNLCHSFNELIVLELYLGSCYFMPHQSSSSDLDVSIFRLKFETPFIGWLKHSRVCPPLICGLV